MASVNESLVREYFEQLGFLVQQPCKYQVIARAKRPAEDVDFLVWRPGAATVAALPPPGVWTGAELRRVPRAAVSVRGWHTDRFSAGLIESSPDLCRFVQPEALRFAEREMGPGPIAHILVAPALPTDRGGRERALARLRAAGVEGVVLFRSLLTELAADVDANANYEKSDVLQLLRILKAHHLLREPQLELFASPRRRSSVRRAAKTSETPPA